jgi:hypothetical protein
MNENNIDINNNIQDDDNPNLKQTIIIRKIHLIKIFKKN